VSGAELWKLRSWLALDEAAQYLSKAMELKLVPADLLRLVLDGYLPLSLHLPVNTKVSEVVTAPDGSERLQAVTRIEGLWDLVPDSVWRLQVEHFYEYAVRRIIIDIDKIGAATVAAGDLRYRLSPDPGQASGFSTRSRCAFPQGSVMALRRTALDAFAAAQRPQTEPLTEKASAEKPLGERERVTLLTIIAALCNEASIDTSKPTAAGVTIASLTETLGAPVAARTIEEHLRRIPEAVERRSK